MEKMDMCDAAEQLANGNYPYMCYYKIFISITGLIMLPYAVKREGFAWLGHPNAKVLFVSSVVTTILCSLFRTILYLFEVHRLHKHVLHVCDLLLPETLSFFLRIPSPFIGSLETVIMLCFAVERTISALLLHRYEKIKQPYGGIAALVGCIIIPSVITYIYIVRPNQYENQTIAPCVETEDNSIFYKGRIFYLAFVGICEIVTVLAITLCYILTKRLLKEFKSGSSHDLGSRYQVRENLSIIPMLIPCFYVHAILMLAASVILFCYVEFTDTINLPTLIVLTEYVNQAPLYAILLAITILSRRRFYRTSPVVVDSSMLGEVYFLELQNQWNPAA